MLRAASTLLNIQGHNRRAQKINQPSFLKTGWKFLEKLSWGAVLVQVRVFNTSFPPLTTPFNHTLLGIERETSNDKQRQGEVRAEVESWLRLPTTRSTSQTGLQESPRGHQMWVSKSFIVILFSYCQILYVYRFLAYILTAVCNCFSDFTNAVNAFKDFF